MRKSEEGADQLEQRLREKQQHHLVLLESRKLLYSYNKVRDESLEKKITNV